jgi:ABC-type branched-subunit amino acid transport system substrate-binding protein
MTAMSKVKGTMTRTKVLAQIKTITYKGITKTIKFDANGDVKGTAIFVNKVVGSKIVQLGLE